MLDFNFVLTTRGANKRIRDFPLIWWARAGARVKWLARKWKTEKKRNLRHKRTNGTIYMNENEIQMHTHSHTYIASQVVKVYWLLRVKCVCVCVCIGSVQKHFSVSAHKKDLICGSWFNLCFVWFPLKM